MANDSHSFPSPRPQVLAFLRDIKEHPDDDTPRLILADWLEDQGGPADVGRAEFIRLQCERARLPEGDPRCVCLEARERQLQEEYGHEWLGPLREVGVRRRFWRGLLRIALPHLQAGAASHWDALLDAAAWRREIEAVAWIDDLDLWAPSREQVAALPLVTLSAVRLHTFDAEVLRELATWPLAGGITRLHLSDYSWLFDGTPSQIAVDYLVKALGAWPLPSCLLELDLSYAGGSGRFGNAGVRALVAWAALVATESEPALPGVDWPRRGMPALTSLRLGECGLDSSAIELLAGCPQFAHLTRLDLHKNGVDARAASALAGSAHLGQLRSLDLRWTNIPRAGVAALLKSVHLACLEELRLSENNLRDDDMEALAAARLRIPLATLSLGTTGLNSWGAAALGASALLAQLRDLDLENNPLGPAGVAALLRQSPNTSLGRLNLARTSLSADGAKVLAGIPLESVTMLKLGGNNLGEGGAAALASATHWRRLTTLDLSNNGLGDAGVRHLAKSALLAQLTTLDLHNNGVTDEGALALAASPYLSPKMWLNLQGNSIRGRGAGPLRDHLGSQVFFV